MTKTIKQTRSFSGMLNAQLHITNITQSPNTIPPAPKQWGVTVNTAKAVLFETKDQLLPYRVEIEMSVSGKNAEIDRWVQECERMYVRRTPGHLSQDADLTTQREESRKKQRKHQREQK